MKQKREMTNEAESREGGIKDPYEELHFKRLKEMRIDKNAGNGISQKKY